MCRTLYVVGNEFDLMHGMNTRYSDFLHWLLDNNRLDVVSEVESVFGNDSTKSYLWTDFETALGQYDFEKAAAWNFGSLYVVRGGVVDIDGSMGAPFLLDVSINSIVKKSFTSWVGSIEVAHDKKLDFDQDSIFLTFNYTETLEHLYGIKPEKVLHIHGCRTIDERLIVGHRNYVDPTTAWKDCKYLRDNNERVQHICDMNELYKPVESIIDRHHVFWRGLHQVTKVVVLGHSCNEIDYLYFVKVAKSVQRDTEWIFYYHTDPDRNRIQIMSRQLCLTNYLAIRQ